MKMSGNKQMYKYYEASRKGGETIWKMEKKHSQNKEHSRPNQFS